MKTIVVDTNVLVAALRSKSGASYRLVQMIGSSRFQTIVSVPLVLEYEDALRRTAIQTGIADNSATDLVDFICSASRHQEVFFLWRPHLRDPFDEMILEAAVAAEADFIVTFNKSDFAGAEQFGIEVVSPKEFLIAENLA